MLQAPARCTGRKLNTSEEESAQAFQQQGSEHFVVIADPTQYDLSEMVLPLRVEAENGAR
jgi:hypothetical protein